MSAINARCIPPASLPIIDIGPLFRRQAVAKRKVADAIAAAACESGFFYVANHSIDQTLIDRIYEQAAHFFALPLDEKLNYHIADSPNHRGYVPQTERGEYADEKQRLYEAFDLALDLAPNDPHYRHHQWLLGPNVWPALAEFRNGVYTYYRAVSDLAQSLCRAFEIHLRLAPGYFRQFMRKPTSQLRLLHYLENDSPPANDDMQMGAHTDYECFTLLSQSGPGLEVLDANDQWQLATPIDGALVVHIGDLMEVWTNGHFKATPHRVVNTGRERFSLPFFCAADFNAMIQPLPVTLSAERPQRYSGLTAGHHLLNQLLRDFPYLRRRQQSGALQLPFEPHQQSLFEHRLNAARQSAATAAAARRC